MTRVIGIDTGGTYTDGVVVCGGQVQAKAKALTTRHDLSIGITQCLLALAGKLPAGDALDMVCVSTTLATNAIVEGRCSPVGLLFLGKAADGAFRVVQTECIPGALDIKGRKTAPLPDEDLRAALLRFRGSGIETLAVSGYASVRNPEQEQRAKAAADALLGIPTACAHELTGRLGFRQRTDTTVLNAGLIPVIRRLIDDIAGALAKRGIALPLLVIKGNGHLTRADIARQKPVETLLSGPAASAAGGRHLSGLDTALIVDMGGTTTDVCLFRNGRVALDPRGARVAGIKTFVEAADVCTYGLGGDSRVGLDARGWLAIGPQKVTPLCRAAAEQSGVRQRLRDFIDRRGREALGFEMHTVYLLRGSPDADPQLPLAAWFPGGSADRLSLAGRPEALEALPRLLHSGAVETVGLTPTDMLHAADRLALWDSEAAQLGRRALALCMGLEEDALADRFEAEMTHRLTAACLESLAAFEGQAEPQSAAARYYIEKSADAGGVYHAEYHLHCPLVAVGAPSAAWMAPVAKALHTTLVCPPHAEVACAVGAAVSNVYEREDALIRPNPTTGGVQLHTSWESRPFATADEAKAYALPELHRRARQKAIDAGCRFCDTGEQIEDIRSEEAGRPALVESRLRVTAFGAPAFTSQDG